MDFSWKFIFLSHSARLGNRTFPKSVLQFVDGPVQFRLFPLVCEQVGLNGLVGKLGETDPKEADRLARTVKLFKQFLGFGNQLIIVDGIRDADLPGGRFKIRIADLDGDASGRRGIGVLDFGAEECTRADVRALRAVCVAAL